MTARASSPLRVRTNHVEWVAERLSERDRTILATVERLRLVTGAQLERLHFADLATPSRARSRRRVLARLVAWRVLLRLERRIGGVRAGSSGLVFALDTTGVRLAQLAAHLDDASSPRRTGEPSVALLAHTLAVTELYVSLVELARSGGFDVSDYLTEPSCWQPNGYGGWLKPDAYLKLSSAQFDDYWWIETDKGTEHLPTIRRKLGVYLDYVNAGGSGPQGVTPRVLVTVPSEARRAAVAELIRRLPEPASALLHAVTEERAPEYLLRVLGE